MSRLPVYVEALSVQSSDTFTAGSAVFDEHNLVSAAGLAPVLDLAEQIEDSGRRTSSRTRSSCRCVPRARRPQSVRQQRASSRLSSPAPSQPLQTAAIERELEGIVEKWTRERQDVPVEITQRLLTSTVRIGQHRFAKAVLTNHGNRCMFCGMGSVIKGGRRPRRFPASHIKPWRDSTSKERLDHLNGLTACPRCRIRHGPPHRVRGPLDHVRNRPGTRTAE